MRIDLTFKKILAIYAAILLVISIVICAVVWNKLDKYQSDYEKSETMGNPANYMNKFVAETDIEAINGIFVEANYGSDAVPGLVKGQARFLSDLAKEGKLAYQENENFAAALPVYDIVSDGKKIAEISLKSLGKNDSFGNHEWQLKEFKFNEEVGGRDIIVEIPSGAQVVYEGAAISQELFTKVDEDSDAIYKKAVALGAKKTDNYRIKLENVLNEPDLAVKTASGETLKASVSGNLYNYAAGDTESLIPAVTNRIYEIMDAYTMNMNNKKPFSEMPNYVERGSSAYSVIANVQSSIVWGWTPERVTILEREASEFVKYTDSMFACTYYSKIDKFKEGSVNENGEETFKLRALFRKVNNVWYLNYFVLE